MKLRRLSAVPVPTDRVMVAPRPKCNVEWIKTIRSSQAGPLSATIRRKLLAKRSHAAKTLKRLLTENKCQY